jgi:hypothetical protein
MLQSKPMFAYIPAMSCRPHAEIGIDTKGYVATEQEGHKYPMVGPG